MENKEQNDFHLEGTGFAYTLSLINGKYKMPILYCYCFCYSVLFLLCFLY